MKKKNLKDLVAKNKQELLNDKKELERIFDKIENKHSKKAG